MKRSRIDGGTLLDTHIWNITITKNSHCCFPLTRCIFVHSNFVDSKMYTYKNRIFMHLNAYFMHEIAPLAFFMQSLVCIFMHSIMKKCMYFYARFAYLCKFKIGNFDYTEYFMKKNISKNVSQNIIWKNIRFFLSLLDYIGFQNKRYR